MLSCRVGSRFALVKVNDLVKPRSSAYEGLVSIFALESGRIPWKLSLHFGDTIIILKSAIPEVPNKY